MKIKADEIIEKYFNKVKIGNVILYDCKKCREHGLRTKLATVRDALIHLRGFHFEGGIYEYFEDIRKIYGQKVLREITSR